MLYNFLCRSSDDGNNIMNVRTGFAIAIAFSGDLATTSRRESFLFFLSFPYWDSVQNPPQIEAACCSAKVVDFPGSSTANNLNLQRAKMNERARENRIMSLQPCMQSFRSTHFSFLPKVREENHLRFHFVRSVLVLVLAWIDMHKDKGRWEFSHFSASVTFVFPLFFLQWSPSPPLERIL